MQDDLCTKENKEIHESKTWCDSYPTLQQCYLSSLEPSGRKEEGTFGCCKNAATSTVTESRDFRFDDSTCIYNYAYILEA